MSALSEGNEVDRGGDHDTREVAGGSPAADEIGAVQDEIRGVERKIEDVEKETEGFSNKIDDVEAAIAGGSGYYLGMVDPEALLRDREQLRREQEQVRFEKGQLRAKEEQLRRKEEQLLEQPLEKKKRFDLRANDPLAGTEASHYSYAYKVLAASRPRLIVSDFRVMRSVLFVRMGELKSQSCLLLHGSL